MLSKKMLLSISKLNIYKLSVLLLLFSMSCNTEEFQGDIVIPNYKNQIAFPLGYLNYTLKELIESTDLDTSSVTTDASNLLYIIYKDSLDFTQGRKFLDIETILKAHELSFPETPALPNSQIIPLSKKFPYEYQTTDKNEVYDSMIYSQGDISLSFTSNINSPVRFNFSIPSLVDENGASLLFTGTVINGTIPKIKDISNNIIKLKNNTFEADLSVDIILDAGENIPAGSKATFILSIKNQEYKAVFGYFGKDTVKMGSFEIETDFLKEFDLGDKSKVEFFNPQIEMQIENTLGIPLDLQFSGFGVKENKVTKINDTTFITFKEKNKTFPVDKYIYNSPVPTKSKVVLSRDNSNINDVFNKLPGIIDINIIGLSNLNNDINNNFYDLTNTNFKIYTSLILPLHLNLQDVNKEIFISVTDLKTIQKNIESLSLRIEAANTIPLEIFLSVLFKDADGMIVSEIKERKVVSTPLLNIEDIAKETKIFFSDIPFSNENIKAIANSTQLSLKLRINTPQTITSRTIYVKFFNDYVLNFKLSLIANLNIDLNK